MRNVLGRMSAACNHDIGASRDKQTDIHYFDLQIELANLVGDGVVG